MDQLGNGSTELAKRGAVLLHARRPQAAVPWLERAIGADPNNFNAHCDLALALFRLGGFADAIRAAERAARVDSSSEWPHYLRALAYLGLKKKKSALAAAREAARLGPDQPNGLHALALALLENGQVREAQVAAERLRTLSPDQAMSYECLALIAKREHRWADAETQFRQALRLDPTSTSAMAGLAAALDEQGRPRDAIELLRNSMRVDADDPHLHGQMWQTVRRFRNGPLIALVENPRYMVLLIYLLGGISAGLVIWRQPDLWLLQVSLATFILVGVGATVAYEWHLHHQFHSLPDAVVGFDAATRRSVLRNMHDMVFVAANRRQLLPSVHAWYSEQSVRKRLMWAGVVGVVLLAFSDDCVGLVRHVLGD